MPRQTEIKPLYDISGDYHMAREHAEQKVRLLLETLKVVMDLHANQFSGMTHAKAIETLKKPFNEAWAALYGDN